MHNGAFRSDFYFNFVRASGGAMSGIVFYGKEFPGTHNPRVVQRGYAEGFWGVISGGCLETFQVVLNTVLEVFLRVFRRLSGDFVRYMFFR